MATRSESEPTDTGPLAPSTPQPVEVDGPSAAPESCGLCGGRGWRIEPDGGAGRAVRCSCASQRRKDDYLDLADIPSRYRNCRLSSFHTHVGSSAAANSQLLRAQKVSQSYVDTFFDPVQQRFRSTGLLFVGPPGVGKTHLAVAVLTELILKYRVRGRFVDFSTLLHKIQTTFDGGSAETKASILQPVVTAEVLVLDELGAQKPSEWVMDNLYLIMNSRYTAGRPTLFTTNFQLAAKKENKETWSKSGRLTGTEDAQLLASRITAPLVSRLYEMAQPLVLSGTDYRREIMMHQHRIGG